MNEESNDANAKALLRRQKIRTVISPLYLPQYDELCELLTTKKEGCYWGPYCGFRSTSEQNEIYAYGRTKPGSIVTWARAGESPHNWGCATDWAEFRPEFKNQEPWENANWDFYGECVKAVGLEWGGSWTLKKKDRPHNELKINVSWAEVCRYNMEKGEAWTLGFIKNNITKGRKK